MTTIIEGKIWSYILECPSVIFLIVINLIPLIGVVAFGWNVEASKNRTFCGMI